MQQDNFTFAFRSVLARIIQEFKQLKSVLEELKLQKNEVAGMFSQRF
jgi:hypothetical protein